MNRLRLGPVTEDGSVKVTVELSAAVMRDLTDYARVHAHLNGLAEPLAPERLIAPMVGRFMATDREFAKQRRRLSP